MMKRFLPAFACLGAVTSGCIFTPGDPSDQTSDGQAESSTTGDNELETGAADTGSDSADTGTTGDDTGTTGDDTGTTGDEALCQDNAIADGGFEAGTPSQDWTETSLLFDSPLCNEACSATADAAAHTGTWWAWFGGDERPESASLSQTFEVDGDDAELGFFFAIKTNEADDDAEASDVFSVLIDDTTVFTATNNDRVDYGEWTDVRVDLSAYADGQPHTLVIQGELDGEHITSFFVDDIELVGCTADDDTSGSDTGADGDTDSGTDSSGGGEESGSDTGGEG